jgi:mannose-1-phosphate guanylyltransferase/mannose-6-phosphate isomerase
MITVIIAGGSGTRLWPLSTPDYPKHLLSLTGSKTLVQYSYERAKTISSSIYVVTDGSHVQHVKDQLPELSEEAFIIEPGRRGTASCIIAALAKIEKDHDKSEPIAFLAADHYIRDTAGFTHSFKIAETASKKTSKIVLVGIEPTYPSTGFGYIKKDGVFDEGSFVFNVDSFKEKPDYTTARQYLNSGNYLWNAGYFVGSVETFVECMKADAPELYENFQALCQTKDSDAFNKVYLGFESISIDYALIEKVKNLLVVPASFDWMDLGSYGDLQKAIGSDENGNHIKGQAVEVEDVENSFIQDHEGKKVAVIGLDNIVVINTPDGILVARKDLAQKVGDVSKRFKK